MKEKLVSYNAIVVRSISLKAMLMSVQFAKQILAISVFKPLNPDLLVNKLINSA